MMKKIPESIIRNEKDSDIVIKVSNETSYILNERNKRRTAKILELEEENNNMKVRLEEL